MVEAFGGCKVLLPGPGPMTLETGDSSSYIAWKTARVLRRHGFEVVGVDSSDASLLALPGCCNRFYLEPLCPESLEAVLEREHPDILLSNVSGVKGMHLCSQLAQSGALKRQGVDLAGASVEIIHRTQDRALFKEVLMDAGLSLPRYTSALSLADGVRAMQKVGFPLVIRPHFTSGGMGTARVCNQEEYLEKLMMALNLSPAREVTVEEDFTGWKEFNCLVARDAKGEMAVLALFEQLEMAGVHSGDSMWVYPVQSPGRELVYFIEQIAGKIARILELRGVMELEIMVHPRMEEVYVSEALPGPGQTTAFSMLAAGADPVEANALLTLGMGLEQLKEEGRVRDPGTGMAVRLPYRGTGHAEQHGDLGLERATLGEWIITGNDFSELSNRLRAFMGDGSRDYPRGPVEAETFQRISCDMKLASLWERSSRYGLPPRQIQRDLPEWFYRLLQGGEPAEGLLPYDAVSGTVTWSKSDVMLLLSGEPHHAGRGPESDLNTAEALLALGKMGRTPVLYGENPIMALIARDLGADAFLGPLTPRAIMDCARERGATGVITQFGGELSLSLSPTLIELGCQVPGLTLDLSSFRGSYLREPRLFNEAGPRIIAEEQMASLEQALEWAGNIGYPHIVYQSGTRGPGRTSIVYNPDDLRSYYREFIDPLGGTLAIRPLYEDGTEVIVEAIAEKNRTIILGLAQNLDDAGSATDDCMLAMPPLSLTGDQAQKVALFVGMVVSEISAEGNVRARVVIKDDTIKLEELYLGASPTLPFLATVTGKPVQEWGIRALLGMPSGAVPELESGERGMALRRAIIPARIAGEEDILPVSMRRSFGSVAGIGRDLGSAFAKAQMEEISFQPGKRHLFISIANRNKRSAVMMAKEMAAMGFDVMATSGTAEALRKSGTEVRQVKKLREGRPNILDLIKNGEVDLIINTPRGKGPRTDGFYIRSASARYGIPCITNMHAATLLVEALKSRRENRLDYLGVEEHRAPRGDGRT